MQWGYFAFIIITCLDVLWKRALSGLKTADNW